MTVVAYSSKHRVMASDSRCTDDDGGAHLTDCRKIYRLRGGSLLGAAGDADARDMIALLGRATPRCLPSRAELAELRCDFMGLLVFRDGSIYRISSKRSDVGREWEGEVLPLLPPFVAVGTGARIALGAMAAGAGPEDAVRIVCKYDLMCAEPVQAERLRKA